MEVASTPVTVPSQRRGLTWIRNACLAGYEKAMAMPSSAFTTMSAVRLVEIP